MNSADFQYVGGELEIFAGAVNWKTYLTGQIRPFLGRDVLEVGAGLGATSRGLCSTQQDSWTALEPDPALAAKAQQSARDGSMPASYEIRTGTTANLAAAEHFDSIIYIDVLEHIDRDADELRVASNHLRARGHLIVLSPAHQWLFSPFDRAIGHYRRYDHNTLSAVGPPNLELVRLRYLDSIGMLASLANRALLRQSLPTGRQIAVWDRMMVPVSRIVDPLLAFKAGKSILAVWQA
jgi:SAM-dependent methyltransferase